MQSLCTETYKTLNELNPPYMKEIFSVTYRDIRQEDRTIFRYRG